MLRSLQPSPLGPDAAPFLWLLSEMDQGRKGAILTVTTVHGGAPRPVGTHMAVVSGKRFNGYLSGGGCVESAIACEVEPVIAAGRDTMLRFGKGSPLLDIRFPCGGGIDVLVHAGVTAELVEETLDRMAKRSVFSIAFLPHHNCARIEDTAPPTGWLDKQFYRRYLPRTRLCLAGRGPELEAMTRLAVAAQYDVMVATPDKDMARQLADIAVDVQCLSSTAAVWKSQDDPWTATVLLFHEREWEDPLLVQALAGRSFYVGALGSTRSHAIRRERLLSAGLSTPSVDRIRGPVGLIPAARDPETLALSVLAEIAVCRREADRLMDAQAGD